jgi:hypothetical protein
MTESNLIETSLLFIFQILMNEQGKLITLSSLSINNEIQCIMI